MVAIPVIVEIYSRVIRGVQLGFYWGYIGIVKRKMETITYSMVFLLFGSSPCPGGCKFVHGFTFLCLLLELGALEHQNADHTYCHI